MSGKKENEVSEELRQLELEEQRLRVQTLREQVNNTHMRREEMKRRHEVLEASLADAQQATAREQAICQHKKGGTDQQQFFDGDDQKYSIIRHTFAWGESRVYCTRCGKEWAPPATALKQADPEAYAQQLADYNQAMRWPTDNSPSGSRLFVIERAG